ncbi:MAG: hypothetical protein HY866_16870 [Chloroflexi bacterium]|nr:hypothetical protein [Chloroflexota bacterium]
MMKTEQEKLKLQIITVVKQSGLPVGTKFIVDRIKLPDHIVLNDLLTELVTEKRLRRTYTLLANGNPDCTYALIS